MVRAIRLSIENVSTDLEEAARTLGASPFKVFYSITLPLISPGIFFSSEYNFLIKSRFGSNPKLPLPVIKTKAQKNVAYVAYYGLV